jgi:hypothetical protein
MVGSGDAGSGCASSGSVVGAPRLWLLLSSYCCTLDLLVSPYLIMLRHGDGVVVDDGL